MDPHPDTRPRSGIAASVPGLIIAAPSSGSGKTTITLALLRALRARGLRVGSIKIGPDFIDPMFHAAAGGRACINLDDWAMSAETFARAVARAAQDADMLLAEGVMGLFDGSGTGRGSTADVAARLGWPVLLVIDVSGMAASAAAIARGFIAHRADVNVAAVILNRLGSDNHERVIRDALAACDVPVVGALRREAELVLPSRHLGLVQAEEHPQLQAFIERAAAWVEAGVDLAAISALARRDVVPGSGGHVADVCVAVDALPPPGQRIAIARDAAFGFHYVLMLEDWQRAGAKLCFFSPLANEAPASDCDAVFLPGGYPELHAGRLAAAHDFKAGMREAAARGAAIYGECGGFMVLGERLVDGDGVTHAMCGLLPASTSFAQPRMTLGYREVDWLAMSSWGVAGQRWRGHEFHFARTVDVEPGAQPLFHARNAAGDDLGAMGVRAGNVCGSFMHLVDRLG